MAGIRIVIWGRPLRPDKLHYFMLSFTWNRGVRNNDFDLVTLVFCVQHEQSFTFSQAASVLIL